MARSLALWVVLALVGCAADPGQAIVDSQQGPVRHSDVAEDHIPGMVLSGPRVARVKPEAQLGDQGTLWELSRSSGAGTVTTALFHLGTQNVMLGANSDSPAFPGYTQRQAVCTRCGTPVGWRFERVGSTPAGSVSKAGSASGGAMPSVVHGEPTPSLSPPALSSLVPLVHVEGEEDGALAALEGMCLTMPKGWWTFQWCHKKKVNQFHRESDGKIGPDWSLGDWDSTGRIERTRPLALPGYYTSSFFTGGQRCDETGKGRATEVQFFCCVHVKASTPFIEEVDEPATCKYRMKICVPDLCVPAQEVTASSAAGSGGEVEPASPSPAPTSSAAITRAEVEGQEGMRARGEDAPQAAARPSRTPFPSPASKLDSSSMPHGFYAAAWSQLLGDSDTQYQAIAGGEMSTGIAPVRFA